MPAGQRNSAINASLGLGPKPDIEAGIGSDPMGRLQRAYERGVVNINDLLDAASTKPKAREVLMRQLNAQGLQADKTAADIADAEARRPSTKTALDAQARSAAATSRVQASIDEALADGLQPDAIGQIASRKIDTLRMGADADAYQQAARFKNLEAEIASNPQRSRLVEIVNSLGGYVPPNATDEEVATHAARFIREKKEEDFGVKLLLERAKNATQNAVNARDAEMKLADVFRKDPTIVNADTVRAQNSVVVSMLTKPTPSAASDMAAVFAFMKMMDPGSVVREGEYERAKNATGFINKWGLQNVWDRVSKGTLMSPEQREDFLETVSSVAKSHTSAAENVRARFTQQANQWGLNPANVVFDVSPTEARKGGLPAANLAPNEVLVAELDEKTGKRTGKFSVYVMGADKKLNPKSTPTPGIDAPDASFDPKSDVLTQGSDILVKSTAIPGI